MRRTGYLRDNRNNPQKIAQQKKRLIQAGCEEVIVERVESLDGDTPALDEYLANVVDDDCLMTINMASLSRDIAKRSNVTKTLAKKSARFEMLAGSFDSADTNIPSVLRFRAARAKIQAVNTAEIAPLSIAKTDLLTADRDAFLETGLIYENEDNCIQMTTLGEDFALFLSELVGRGNQVPSLVDPE